MLGGWEQCRALITFGTPYRGAPVAADYLANGARKFGVQLRGLTKLVSSFPSVYQLLPRYAIVRDISPEAKRLREDGAELPLLRVGELPVERVGDLSVEQARLARENFHVKLRSPRLQGDQAWNPLAGFGHGTVQALEYDGKKLTVAVGLPSARELAIDEPLRDLLDSGDGTVPALSAIPLELAKQRLWSWENGKHGTAHCERYLLRKLVLSLAAMGSDVDTSHLEGPSDDEPEPERPATEQAAALAESVVPAAGPTLDLALDAVFASDEPVEIRCAVRATMVDAPATLTITAADGSTTPVVPALEPCDESGAGFRWELPPLPPGAYQATVSAGSLELTTSDVFEVLEAENSA
ncbi:hypothetical protein I6A84_21675 [Frankia sp. CNm7]|uniref:Uncharacterized protein n=1 Tax=Frankia nepalensis TaxID=1836974 RepID=A0A937RN06_9ACTN|nr:hypothetical protein [Frankia nepalensis]MBL7496194.1 hypothetical protein [Frankia nepalensis]MBL7511604.1 hypothetical protein [Frankia nepalensis]MBL7520626.1 hypothetical protein [Frankia nepalensis]MBL7630279.1 hypothetical protein [Frankia nepalensis]